MTFTISFGPWVLVLTANIILVVATAWTMGPFTKSQGYLDYANAWVSMVMWAAFLIETLFVWLVFFMAKAAYGI